MRNLFTRTEDRFEELFKRSFDLFFDGLHRYALTLVKDTDKASDVVQSVYVKWWENQRHIDDMQEIKAYLYTAVYRTCLNQIRNDKSKMTFSHHYYRENEQATSDVQRNLEFDELNEYMKEAIDDLPPQCRVIFCKSRFEEKRYAEIADEMDLSIKTVEAQMGKALKQLREKLRTYLLSPN